MKDKFTKELDDIRYVAKSLKKEHIKEVMSQRVALKAATNMMKPRSGVAKWARRGLLGVLLIPGIGLGGVAGCCTAYDKLTGDKPVTVSDLSGEPKEEEKLVTEPPEMPVDAKAWYDCVGCDEEALEKRNVKILQEFVGVLKELYQSFLKSDPDVGKWGHREISIDEVKFLVSMMIEVDLENDTFTVHVKLKGQPGPNPFFYETQATEPIPDEAKKSCEPESIEL